MARAGARRARRGRVWLEPAGHGDASFAAAWPACPWPVVAVSRAMPRSPPASPRSTPAGRCGATTTSRWRAARSVPRSAASSCSTHRPAASGRRWPWACSRRRSCPPTDVCREARRRRRASTGERSLLLVARTASLAGTPAGGGPLARDRAPQTPRLAFDLRADRAGQRAGRRCRPWPPTISPRSAARTTRFSTAAT